MIVCLLVEPTKEAKLIICHNASQPIKSETMAAPTVFLELSKSFKYMLLITYVIKAK